MIAILPQWHALERDLSRRVHLHTVKTLALKLRGAVFIHLSNFERTVGCGLGKCRSALNASAPIHRCIE